MIKKIVLMSEISRCDLISKHPKNKCGLHIVFLIFMFVLLIIPAVMAVEVTVKTYANREVAITLINPSSGDSVGFSENTTDSGTLIMSISTSLSMVDVSVIIRNNGKIETMKKFSGYATGNAIVIDMRTPEPPPVVVDNPPVVENVGVNSSTVQQNDSLDVNSSIETNNKNSSLLGWMGNFSIFEGLGNRIDMKVVYYILGIISVLVIAFFVYRFRGSFRKFFKKETDYFPKLSHSHVEIEYDDRRLRDAEHRLRAAQEEIEKINKIRGAEKKLADAKRDLDRLKR